MNRRKKLIIGVIVAVFIMMAFLPTVDSMPANGNIANVATGCGHNGGYVTFEDILHQYLFKTHFSAYWKYSCLNGSSVKEYSPSWSFNKNGWDLVAWIHMDKAQWAHKKSGDWMAYGDGEYHVGIWYISTTQSFYSSVTVEPNSYGGSTFNSGSGYVS